MARVTWLLVITVGTCMVQAWCLAGPAATAVRPSFLDDRPVMIDLDVADQEDRWSVELVVPLDSTVDTVGLEAVMSPQVLKVERPAVPLRQLSSATAIATFTIVLSSHRPSTGALVLSDGDGVVTRRTVIVERGVSSLVLSETLGTGGVRTHPFGGGVRIRPIELAEGRNEASAIVELPEDRSEASTIVGRVVNGSDSALVVRTPGGLSFSGVDRTGRYQGTVDLRPGLEGGESKVEVTVRDQFMWCLIVLGLGLGIVSLLDVGRRRRRPERVLALQLRRLVERAQAAQRLSGVTLRITAGRQEPLLLDELQTQALADFRGAVDDHTRQGWAPGGAELKAVKQRVDDFERLCADQQTLAGQRHRLLVTLPASEYDRVAEALERSKVGRAMAPRAIRSPGDLQSTGDVLSSASSFLGSFLATLSRLRAAAAGPDAGQAGDLLVTLLADPDSLDRVAGQTAALRLRTPAPDTPRLAPGGASSPPVPGFGQWSPRAEPRAEWRAERSTTHLPLRPVGVVLGLVAIAVLAVSQSYGPNYSTTVPTTAPAAPALLPAPTAADLAPPGLPDEPASRPAFWLAAAVAVVVAGVLAAVCWWLWRRLLRPAVTDRPAVQLESELARADLGLSVAAGVLVVLSGMVALYFSNPTFGTAGDYLGALLWGTSLSTGVELARRFTEHTVGR